MPALTLAAIAAALTFGSVLLLNNLLWQIEAVQACFANSSAIPLESDGVAPGTAAACTPTLWRGFVFAGGVLACKLVETLFIGHSCGGRRIALRVRSALISTLYEVPPASRGWAPPTPGRSRT